MNLKPTITAVVIADSISPAGVRVTTLALRYPRIVHSEFMTHRVFSRNAGSSRAIPTAKMLRQIRREPAAPVEWGSNQPGMQAGAPLTGWRLWGVKATWSTLAKISAFGSWVMMKLGAHKQVANRVTEAYQYMNTLVTSTEWENFEELRCHPEADPTIRDLAIEIMTAIAVSTPMPLGFDQWHLPYITEDEKQSLPLSTQLKVSTARCARVSYAPFDGNAQIEKEVERHDKLVGSRPVHSSPTEHVCRPMGGTEVQFGNLKGWRQYRHQVEADAHQRDLKDGKQKLILSRSWTDAERVQHETRKAQVTRQMQRHVLRDLGSAELPTRTSFSRVGETDRKSSHHGGLTSSDEISPILSLNPTRIGYPYPLHDPHPHDAPLAGQEKGHSAFSGSTYTDPSPSSYSDAGGDSGGSSNE